MRKGFTLVEVIVSMSLLGLILITITTIFITTLKNYRVESGKSFLQKEINFAMDNIGKDIKQAVEVPTAYDSFNLSPQALILAIPTTNADGDFIYSGGQMEKDYLVYYLDDNNLKKKVYPNPLGTKESSESVILTNVSNLGFTYLPAQLGARQVITEIKLVTNMGKANIILEAEKTANLRNKE